jgi:hypothetical protein
MFEPMVLTFKLKLRMFLIFLVKFKIYLGLGIRIFLLFWFRVLKTYHFGLGLESF